MKNVVLVLIILFSFTILFSAEFKVVKDIEENPMHLALVRLDKSEKVDINGDVVGLIIVSSGIKDLFVDSAFKQKQEYKYGDYYIYLSPGTKFITFKKSGFVNHKYNLRDKIGGIKSGIVYEMSVDEKFKQASQIPIIITCNQNGADIFVDSNFKGKISKGKLICYAEGGEQILKIIYNGFEPIEETIDIKAGNQSFDYELVEIVDKIVKIKSNPSGAYVWVNGKKIGKTPVKAFFPAGVYTIKLKKDNYETINEQISITDFTKKTYFLKLKEPIVAQHVMIGIEGGNFQMGSNNSSREKPVHIVVLGDFYIGKYEVTQKEWKDIMGNNPSKYKGENLPVERVSWYDAVEFCNKKSISEGLTPCYSGSEKDIKCDFSQNGYRLPTEAEWEYAARGGVEANQYSPFLYAGSNNINDVAWYESNSWKSGVLITTQVGSKKGNQLGIYDMSGNVWEWCYDKYDSKYYSTSSENNPKGPFSGSKRVTRGGSRSSNKDTCRITKRFSDKPNEIFNKLGFRLARSAN